MEKIMIAPQLSMKFPYDLATKELKTGCGRYIPTTMVLEALFKIAQKWKKPKCLSKR